MTSSSFTGLVGSASCGAPCCWTGKRWRSSSYDNTSFSATSRTIEGNRSDFWDEWNECIQFEWDIPGGITQSLRIACLLCLCAADLTTLCAVVDLQRLPRLYEVGVRPEPSLQSLCASITLYSRNKRSIYSVFSLLCLSVSTLAPFSWASAATRPCLV